MEKHFTEFLKMVSTKNDITMKNAIQKVNSCFGSVSSESGIALSNIIANFYKYFIVTGDCEGTEKDVCIERDNCSYYNDTKCISNIIQDYELINNDPDTYMQELSEEQTIELKNLASYLYHNFGYSGLTRESYVSIKAHIHSTQPSLEYYPVSEIHLENKFYYQMNVAVIFPVSVGPKDESFAKFLINSPHAGIIWREKFSGIYCVVIYSDGVPINLYSIRKTGEGRDISHLLQYINFPTNIEDKNLVTIFGQLAIKKSVFLDKYDKLYRTEHELIVKQTNSPYITSVVTDIDFIALDIIDETIPHLYKNINILKKYGFTVTGHGRFNNKTTMIDITIKYKECVENSLYKISGLLLDYDSKSVSKKVLKMDFTEPVRTTFVTKVEWDISRNGTFVPVMLCKTVRIDNNFIDKVYAKNATYIRDLNIGVNTILKVTRKNGENSIVSVETNVDTDVIYPTNEYAWHWDENNIVLNDIETNIIVKEERILYFLEIMGISGIGQNTISKLCANGFDTVPKIVNSSDLTGKGIVKHKSSQIKSILEKSMSTIPVDRYLIAFPFSKLEISRKLIKHILCNFPEIIEKSHKDIIDILGNLTIQGISTEVIATQLIKFREFLNQFGADKIKKSIQYQYELAQQTKNNGYNRKIRHRIFAFVGFRKFLMIQKITYTIIWEMSVLLFLKIFRV